MCFSANVSFITAGGLAIIGLLSMYLAKNKKELFFAATPFFFAIQQAAEGLVWLALPQHVYLAVVPKYIYLFFAFMFWPVWIPLAVSMYEKEFWRKIVIYACLLVGFFLAIYFLRLFVLFGVDASAQFRHIKYTFGITHSLMTIIFLNLLYFIATIAPLFISSRPSVWIFGATVSIAYVISFIFFHAFLASIWCFFAAVLSVMVLYFVYSGTLQDRA